MPEIFIYPNTGAMVLAGLVRTDLVAAVLKLFKNDVIPAPSTVLADLEECDFSGYAEVDPVEWQAVFLDPQLGGASFQTFNQWNFDGADVTPTTNTVYGYWIESVAGTLLAVGTFENPIPMMAGGDSIPALIKLNF